MSNSTRKFGVTEDRFVPKIPSPRPALPRMMIAKPVKPRTASISEDKPRDLSDEEESRDSDSSDDDETDDAPNNQIPIKELHSLEALKKLNFKTQKNKKTIAKEPEETKIQTRLSSTQTQNNSVRNYYYISIFIILLALAAYACAGLQINIMRTEESSENTQSENVLRNFEDNIDSISNKFKQQNSEIWDDIIAGVSEVVKHPDKLSIILLFSQDDNIMNCLAKMIGNASKAALGSSEELLLSPSQLGNDPGDIIHNFKNRITKQKIVIVDNLLDVNPNAMTAFHHLCDREKPLIRQVVYILTMVTKGFRGKYDNPVKFVENQLKLKLNDKINSDKVDPLITRMTDGVIIPVQPEPDFKSCPLRY